MLLLASVAADGRESVLAFRGPGEVLGELSAIDGQPRSARVATRLVEPAAEYGREQPGGGILIDLPITQEELAGWVGYSREGVNKARHALRGLRWVATERRAITVLDVEALKRRAG